MASDGVPVSIPTNLVQGGQAAQPSAVASVGGNLLPQGGKGTAPTAPITAAAAARATAQAATAQAVTVTNKSSVSALVQQLNKYLNDSGRANEFRVDPASRDETIQEINPATGEVIGEFAASEFPALARSLGVSGVLVDDHA